MLAVALLLPYPAAAQPADGLTEQLVRDFRGPALPPDVVPFGAPAKDFLRPEPEGLRLSLGRDRESLAPVGVTMAVALGGDFEITAGIDILQADAPPVGAMSYGVGVLLSVNDAARVGRLQRARHKVITWDKWAPGDGERKFVFGYHPWDGPVGRLRLARAKDRLRLLFSQRPAGDTFHAVHEYDFPDEVRQLRIELNADLAGRAGAVDVRLTDLTIRSSTPILPPAPAPAPAADGDAPPDRSRWLQAAAAVVGLGMGVVLVGALVLRRRGASRRPAMPDSPPRPRG